MSHRNRKKNRNRPDNNPTPSKEAARQATRRLLEEPPPVDFADLRHVRICPGNDPAATATPG